MEQLGAVECDGHPCYLITTRKGHLRNVRIASISVVSSKGLVI